jgi:uncharacterized membrane protein (DUF485 family)
MEEEKIGQLSKNGLKKKATISFVLGIILFVYSMGMLLISFVPAGINAVTIFIILSFPFPVGLFLFGIILGIQGLKSAKKHLAISGIGLCMISLLILILVILFNLD